MSIYLSTKVIILRILLNIKLFPKVLYDRLMRMLGLKLILIERMTDLRDFLFLKKKRKFRL